MQKNNEPQEAVKILLEQLRKSDRDCELMDRRSECCVDIRFIGRFKNILVVWYAKINSARRRLTWADLI